jgi:hypothetical protein
VVSSPPLILPVCIPTVRTPMSLMNEPENRSALEFS